MKVNELNLAGKKDPKRVGRGIGSGYGKTAGRGTKGQNSRTGGGVRPGFEGGQNPLAKRLPKKRGFQSLNPTNYQVINLTHLEGFAGKGNIGFDELVQAGIIKRSKGPVKLLGSGELTKKVSLSVNAVSSGAKAKVEAVGGSVEVVAWKNVRPVKEKTPRKDAA